MRRHSKPHTKDAALVLAAMAGLATGCYRGGPEVPAAGDPSGSDSGVADGPGDDGDGGSEGDDGGDDGVPTSCADDGPSAASRPMRLLTPTQHEASVSALLGIDDPQLTYDSTSAVIGIRGVRQLHDDAEALAARHAEWSTGLIPCDIGGAEDPACPEAFIAKFAPLAFRRPLRTSESAWLTAAYADARDAVAFGDAMEVLAATILQAPPVVYVEELGEPGAEGPIVPLTQHEVANRIALFLWGAPPDAALRDAATDGRLSDPDEVRAQVDRMLEDPRGQAQLGRSIWSALELDGRPTHFSLFDAEKDSDLFPEFGLGLQYAMQVEFEAFVASVLEGDASFAELMTSRRAYVDDRLAQLYGVAAPPAESGGWHWVDLPADERAGLLTRAAFLTVFANTTSQSAIRRGTVVLEEVLCFELGEPPPNVNDTPIEGGDHGEGNWTVRQATEARTQAPECNACHSTINPVGFLFEHYDAIGAWQTTEAISGLPVDAAADFDGTDVAGAYADAVELSAAIAESDEARACFAKRWLSEGVGGPLGALDECSKDEVVTRFQESGDLRELVKAVVLSDSFGHLNLDPAEGGE